MDVFVVSAKWSALGSPSPGRSSRREIDRKKVQKHTLCQLVIRTERAPTQSQRLAKKLLALRLSVAPRERERQVGRRDQRVLVLCAEQAGHKGEHVRK